MKIRITLAAALAAILALGASAQPPEYYSKIAQKISRMLPAYHVSQHPFDDEISAKAWTNLVNQYDSTHSIFLQSDIDILREMEFKIDDALKAGDISFGWKVQELFKVRLADRVAYATNLLERGEWDFDVQEEYLWKRKDAPWPQTKEEQDDIWRRRIKNEFLAQTLARELDAEEAAAKAKGDVPSEGGEKAEEGAVAVAGNDESGEKSDDGDGEALPKLTPKENLMKRYRQYLAVMSESDDEETLQRYMSAVMQAYDPHTDYLSPTSKEEFDMDMNLTLCGVGATLSFDDGALKISDIIPGGPLDRDGRIKKGDRIVAVGQGDGPMEDILYKPMKKSIKKIRGPKDTEVVLEIIPRTDPSGETRVRYKIVRDEIHLEEQAATGRVEKVVLNGVTNTFGYVKLPGFYGTMDKRPDDPDYVSCSLDVAKYVSKFNACDVDGMVLDLRGNGGGSLLEAILLTAIFSPPMPVVQIREAHRLYVQPISEKEPSFAFSKPLIVMIDRASASASEIVATALQDSGRAIVVGDTQSHGKGTVQTVMRVNNEDERFGSAKITTARFYRINGSSTQVKGVASDIRIPSLLDGLDIGEDKLPNALPWSCIQPAHYPRVWNLDIYARELREMSRRRTQADPVALSHERLVDWFAATSEKETVPLDRARRLEQMREDRRMRKEADPDTDFLDEDDEDLSPRERRKKDAERDDAVLKETFNILHDLVTLTGGAEAPRPKRKQIPVWMNNLFF